MASQKLTRTSYVDPSHPANAPTQEVQDREALVDFTDYEKPLERVHGSSLHGWGIASGLSVTSTTNPSGLQVLPGVAIDSTGQHISLAVGGYAQSGTTPPNSQATLIPPYAAPPQGGMDRTGVNIPTAGLNGSMYLTIKFCETFNDDLKVSSGLFQTDHTPWLQLISTTDGTFHPDDGTRADRRHLLEPCPGSTRGVRRSSADGNWFKSVQRATTNNSVSDLLLRDRQFHHVPCQEE